MEKSKNIGNEGLNRLVISPEFYEIAKDLKKNNINLPKSSPHEYTNDYQTQGKVSCLDTKITNYKLNPNNGSKKAKIGEIVAYDESIQKFQCLEGSAYYVCHSIVLMSDKSPRYVPASYVTFNFYTTAEQVAQNTKLKMCEKNIEREFNKDTEIDKIDFLVENVPAGSILLIDGPLIAGDYYTYMIDKIDNFIAKGIIPIFFVKNSSSNLVIENIPELRAKYNSDLHWSFKELDEGERSSFFRFTDLHAPKNSKMFCYLKGFRKASPQRVEFHVPTFANLESNKQLDDIMDLIYYLVLAQGNPNDPQVRPIAIAEMFAKESLKVLNIMKMLERSSWMQATMNQARGYI